MNTRLFSTPRVDAAASSLISQNYIGVLGARNRDELCREVVGFGRRLGFDTVSATLVIDSPGGLSQFIWVDNTPSAYRDFFSAPGNFSGCPVMQHCKVHGTPIVWDQSTYVGAGEGERWEYQAKHGYRFGIGLALHLPKGRHFFVGVDRDQALPEDTDEVARMVGSLSLFALHAHEPAAKILGSESAESRSHSPLTPRELEVLRWTLDGKTAWEVGMILAISARTAAIHANNATRKLDCVNKHQAALRALQSGLI